MSDSVCELLSAISSHAPRRETPTFPLPEAQARTLRELVDRMVDGKPPSSVFRPGQVVVAHPLSWVPKCAEQLMVVTRVFDTPAPINFTLSQISPAGPFYPQVQTASLDDEGEVVLVWHEAWMLVPAEEQYHD